MHSIKCLVLVSLISLGNCQDRIIVSNLTVDDAFRNSSAQNNTIPEKLLIQLKDVRNISDLLRFITIEDDLRMLGPSLDNGTESRRALSAVATSTIAIPASCQTEQQIVELEKPENGAIIFWPMCVRIRRCGGCCTSNMLACKPLVTSITNVTVLQMFYNHENPNAFENQGTRLISLEQHDRCACTCKERIEDCNLDVHEYNAGECRCICKNVEQAASCRGPKKVWDSKNCACKCRKVKLCSSGLYFNTPSCRCEVIRRSLTEQSLNMNISTIS